MEKEQQAENGNGKPKADPQKPTMMSAKIDKIIPALIKAQEKIKTVTKSKTAGAGHRSWDYADLTDCLDAGLPHLNENGIALAQVFWPDENGATRLVSLLLHTSGQFIASALPLRPKTDDAHGIGSAITYARRYTFCPQVGIGVAGEDDDGTAAMATSTSTAVKPRPFKARER